MARRRYGHAGSRIEEPFCGEQTRGRSRNFPCAEEKILDRRSVGKPRDALCGKVCVPWSRTRRSFLRARRAKRSDGSPRSATVTTTVHHRHLSTTSSPHHPAVTCGGGRKTGVEGVRGGQRRGDHWSPRPGAERFPLVSRPPARCSRARNLEAPLKKTFDGHVADHRNRSRVSVSFRGPASHRGTTCARRTRRSELLQCSAPTDRESSRRLPGCEIQSPMVILVRATKAGDEVGGAKGFRELPYFTEVPGRWLMTGRRRAAMQNRLRPFVTADLGVLTAPRWASSLSGARPRNLPREVASCRCARRRGCAGQSLIRQRYRRAGHIVVRQDLGG
jgi:hypothetical protein